MEYKQKLVNPVNTKEAKEMMESYAMKIWDSADKEIEKARAQVKKAKRRANEADQRANEADQRANEADQRANEADQRADRFIRMYVATERRIGMGEDTIVQALIKETGWPEEKVRSIVLGNA